MSFGNLAQQDINQAPSAGYGGLGGVGPGTAQSHPLAVYEVPRPMTVQVVHVVYTGGILGLFSGRSQKFSGTCQQYLSQGYRLAHVLPGRPSLLRRLLELSQLVLTLSVYTQEQGEMLVFERPS